MATLASMLVADAARSKRPLLTALAQDVSRATRLSLDESVLQQMDDLPLDRVALLEALSQGHLHLPYEKCWLEFFDGPHRVGLLARLDDRALIISGTFYINDAFCPLRALGRVEGFRILAFAEPGMSVEDKAATAHAMRIASYIVLRFMLLISAKGTPAVIGPGEDFARLNKRREKAGRTPVLACRPVRWDLSREVRYGNATGRGQNSVAAAHMVRGHMKVRKTGIYWWRPYFRNVAPGDAPPPARDYHVTA